MSPSSSGWPSPWRRSANLPVIVLSIFWKRFNTAGGGGGACRGAGFEHRADHHQPECHGNRSAHDRGDRAAHHPARDDLPLKNPGIISIPLGFLAAVIGTLLTREPASEAKFTELSVRANTGLGAEKATTH